MMCPNAKGEDVSQIGIEEFFAGGPEAGHDLSHLDGIPYQDGIRQQAQTARLIHDFLQIARSELAPVGEKEPLSQDVPVLSSIQLQLYTPPKIFFLDVTQDVDSLDDPTKRGERLGEAIGGTGAGQ